MLILAKIPPLDISAPPSYWQVSTGHILIRDPRFKTTYTRVEKPKGKFLHGNFNIWVLHPHAVSKRGAPINNNNNNNNNNNVYWLQVGRHPVAVAFNMLHMHGLWRLII